MSKINLLPWREEVKKARNIEFYIQAGLAAILGAMLVLMAHLWFSHRIEVERNNIQYLKHEEKNIVDKVKEIQGLQNDKNVLLERMKVIQTLDYDRLLVPKILDILPKTIPEGVFLKGLGRTKEKIVIMGNAQSNANISTFLKNLEEMGNKTGLYKEIKLTEVLLDKSGLALDFKIEINLGNLT